jgi:thiamine biosynthesis lipoprotein
MKRIFLGIAVFAVLFSVGLFLSPKEDTHIRAVKRSQIALGTVIEMQVRHPDKEKADEAISQAFAEIRRVEAQFTRQDSQSPIGRINRSETTSFSISPEIYDLMKQSEAFWRRTSGAFDASLGAVIDLWGFSRGQGAVPAASQLVKALKHSGWQHVRLEADYLVRRTAAVQFDFGAIAKGYAVDRAVAVLNRYGMADALVNAGGEIRSTGGTWFIGIAHPRKKGEMLRRLNLQNMAVATSGDYEQYFEKNGKRYHHILDPRTGWPAEGCQSVTVLAADDTTADALATGLFVLGAEKAMRLVQGTPGVHALVVDRNGGIHISPGFKAYLSD